MNRQFVQDIVEPLTKVVGVDKVRLSLALAIGLGYALPLPNAAVENPAVWYQEQYRWKVTQFVSEFNERFLVDINLVQAGVHEVWLGRYRACHVHTQAEVEAVVTGNTPAAVFLAQYAGDGMDYSVVANAAFLLKDKITPVILDMSRPGAAVK